MKKSKQNGYTLVELLVVISIISLLSSIVLASVASAKKAGQVAYIQSQMKQYFNAMALYEADNGGYPNVGLFNTSCLGHGPCVESDFTYPENSTIIQKFSKYISGAPTVKTGSIYMRFLSPDPMNPDVMNEVVWQFLNATYACSDINPKNNQCSWAVISWPAPSSNPSACAPGVSFSPDLDNKNQICRYDFYDY